MAAARNGCPAETIRARSNGDEASPVSIKGEMRSSAPGLNEVWIGSVYRSCVIGPRPSRGGWQGTGGRRSFCVGFGRFRYGRKTNVGYRQAKQFASLESFSHGSLSTFRLGAQRGDGVGCSS